MNKKDRDFLNDLLITPSPTGQEMSGQQIWAARMRESASDVSCDLYGNTWAMLKGKTDRMILLEAHADEIGYMVKYIDSKGFIRLDKVGGSDVAAARGKRVAILGDRGEVKGVVGNTAVHLRANSGKGETAPGLDDLWVDIGARNQSDAADLGVRIGQHVVYSDEPMDLHHGLLVGRALDNRVGSYILAKVMENAALNRENLSFTLVCLNAVQEEIGGKGAAIKAQGLKPDVVICIDACHATDTPGLDPASHGEIRLGEGPVLTHGGAIHSLVARQISTVSQQRQFQVQHASSGVSTGTDADKLFLSTGGIPTALVSYPTRYMHSAVETVALSDVAALVELLTAFVFSLEKDQEFGCSLQNGMPGRS